MLIKTEWSVLKLIYIKGKINCSLRSTNNSNCSVFYSLLDENGLHNKLGYVIYRPYVLVKPKPKET